MLKPLKRLQKKRLKKVQLKKVQLKNRRLNSKAQSFFIKFKNPSGQQTGFFIHLCRYDRQRPTNTFGPGGQTTRRGRRSAHTHRSEEHTSELQSRPHLVCRLLLEKKKTKNT